MPGLFARFKSKDGKGKKGKNGKLGGVADQLNLKPQWVDAFTRVTVEPREVQDLVHRCTEELKARALDHPFLLLPFRPTSDPSAVRTFIRHFFDQHLGGDVLAQELRMTEPMVVSGVIKWCWSRLPGGVVGWDVYELFKAGETDSNLSRDSFKTFIPLSVDDDDDKRNSMARASIIFNFFDLMAAIAAHGKMNGFGGRKLSRMASWWAFEHKDTGEGFDGGYKSWLSAADATSHLFFAYLRSMAPESPMSGITMIPMALQKLLQETEYPPQRPALMQSSTYRVVMIVDTVSPTPFSLLRRANHFQYRDEDRPLQDFSEYEDPVQALTEECKRVLKAISSANQSQVSSSKHSTSLRDASWSRFEDIGFASALEEEEEEEDPRAARKAPQGLRTAPASGTDDLGRPTTPSWADFLSSGFVNDGPSNLLLPPDKVLPPIETAVRQRSSQSHRPRLESDRHLEPGELASISRFDLDDAFWWVWMSSLAPEETADRKSAFGRCAIIETAIRNGRWLVMEEMVKGAAPDPDPTAYIAEKKSFFSWTKRSKGLGRRKSTGKGALDKNSGGLKPVPGSMSASKTSIAPDQQAKIHAAAQQLHAKSVRERQGLAPARRGRTDPELSSQKTSSVFTLQPVILNEASSAMKWATQYDKQAVREAYLADSSAGRGIPNGLLSAANGTDLRPAVPEKSPSFRPQPSPGLPSASAVALPITPAPQLDDEEPQLKVNDKAFEAPQDPHPAQRSAPSPIPPPKDEHTVPREAMASPEPVDVSPDSKKRGKLHKDKEKEKTGGFRKLFGRKNRTSKVPDNAAEHLHSIIQSPEPEAKKETPAPVQPTPPAAPTPAAARTPTVPLKQEPQPFSIQPTPAQTPAANNIPEPAYEPSIHETVSRVDTEDAREANQEFARFDQGPLDAPAFAPDSDGESDDATPPPIQRRAREATAPAPAVATNDPPSPEQKKGVPIQDRWAQIRKNAADRAAQRQSEEQSRGGHSKTTDGDDDTSGEETIESRVARIKARVAELTGNMEQVSGPGTSTPPPIRR
ncbi:putative morphogenesis protein [Zalerion maritima]|uniref:Morphogenesis protein n=1 Tax=Zalerion maritima TaxID=339359 RepID=A0AAD5RWE9_9PEZI|nr:putative morphogenesis protein [Zalerion maritima]